MIESLKEMVAIESGSADMAGLAKMATLIDGRLKALGFNTERRKAGDSAETVLGTLQGTGKAKMMLQTHMNTVYPSGILATQPYKVDGNRVYGPGIADDKGGIAVILHALQIRPAAAPTRRSRRARARRWCSRASVFPAGVTTQKTNTSKPTASCRACIS